MAEKQTKQVRYRVKTYIQSKVVKEFADLGKALTAAQKREFESDCLREIYEVLPGGDKLAATIKVSPEGNLIPVNVES